MLKSIRFFLVPAIAISLFNCLNAQNKLQVGIHITPTFKIGEDGLFDDNLTHFTPGRIFNYGAFLSYNITNSVSLNTGWNITKRNVKLKHIDIEELNMIHVRYRSIPILINYSINSFKNSLNIIPYLGAGVALNIFPYINNNKNYNKNNETIISTELIFRSNPKVIPSAVGYLGITRKFDKIGKISIEIVYNHLLNNEFDLNYNYSVESETRDESVSINTVDIYTLRLIHLNLKYYLPIKFSDN